MTIAYRGTRYHGWQSQPLLSSYTGPDVSAGHGLPTVQETLSRTLARVLRHPVRVSGSSRTDTGVHAKGQVAHFNTDKVQIPIDGLRRAINHALPDDILVRKLEPVSDAFDARRSSMMKRYQYQIWNHRERPVFFTDLAWHRWFALDVNRMREAAKHFVGTHDFESFARPRHGKKSAVRTIHRCDVSQRGPRIVVGVEGPGFLWNMVRIMVGTLVHVGMGRAEPDVILEMLAARRREAAGPTAPAHGLYLQWIKMKPGFEPAAMPEQSPIELTHAEAASDEGFFEDDSSLIEENE